MYNHRHNIFVALVCVFVWLVVGFRTANFPTICVLSDITGSEAMTAQYARAIWPEGGFCLTARKADNGDVVITAIDCSVELPFVCTSGWFFCLYM